MIIDCQRLMVPMAARRTMMSFMPRLMAMFSLILLRVVLASLWM